MRSDISCVCACVCVCVNSCETYWLAASIAAGAVTERAIAVLSAANLAAGDCARALASKLLTGSSAAAERGETEREKSTHVCRIECTCT